MTRPERLFAAIPRRIPRCRSGPDSRTRICPTRGGRHRLIERGARVVELPTTWFEAKCSIQLSYGRGVPILSDDAPGEIVRRDTAANPSLPLGTRFADANLSNSGWPAPPD